MQIRVQCHAPITRMRLYRLIATAMNGYQKLLSSYIAQNKELHIQTHFNSNYQYMYVIMSPLHHHLYIILSHYGSCNSTDEDPWIETFGLRM